MRVVGLTLLLLTWDANAYRLPRHTWRSEEGGEGVGDAKSRGDESVKAATEDENSGKFWGQRDKLENAEGTTVPAGEVLGAAIKEHDYEKEAELDKKDVELDKKEAELDKKDVELDKKEVELDKKDVELDKKEVELDMEGSKMEYARKYAKEHWMKYWMAKVKGSMKVKKMMAKSMAMKDYMDNYTTWADDNYDSFDVNNKSLYSASDSAAARAFAKAFADSRKSRGF